MKVETTADVPAIAARNPHRMVVATVMVCHFIAAFAALGMPPFFALILERSLHSEAVYLAGWLYVVPTFFTAVSSPWWGKLADRYGKKPLLLRAQLGLAASFALAGFAPNSWVFFVALVLQGFLGGTFSASNAYLSTVQSGAALARSLTLMQWSARAALVIAPVGLGWFMMVVDSPLTLYRYLAFLPLLAAVLIWRLPAQRVNVARPAATRTTLKVTEATMRQIYGLQCIFIFSTVITFPYFVPFLATDTAPVSPVMAGLLFGLPHVMYLLCAMPLNRYMGRKGMQSGSRTEPMVMLAMATSLLAASLLGQALASTLPAVAAWRVVMGLAMTTVYIGLHSLIANLVDSNNAGARFGWFESSAKWGAVGAGLVAGFSVQLFELRTPFFIGAAALLMVSCYLWAIGFHRQRQNKLEQ